MSAATGERSAARRVLAGGRLCAVVSLATVAWCASAVAVCGAQAPLRSFLGFGFDGVPPTVGSMVSIAKTNGTLAAAPLIAAGLGGALSKVRVGVEVVLGALLLTNSALIGLALGAYGARLAAALALHTPCELAAFSLAGGAYIAATRDPLPARVLAASAASSALLVLAGATVETYVPPGAL